MKNGEIQFADGPGERKPFIRVINPKPKAPVETIIVSHRVVGLYTHFMHVGGHNQRPRTTPCTGHRLFCPGCFAKRSKRWKGYLGCWSKTKGVYVIAEITADCARSCPILVDKSASLRGRALRLERKGEQANSPVYGIVRAPAMPVQLPPDFDVLEALTRLWGWESQIWAGHDGTSATGPLETHPNDDGSDE